MLPRLWLAVTFSLALPVAAFASDLTEPIEQLDASLLKVMKAGKSAPFQDRYDILTPFVARAFDLDAILQDAVGAPWKSLQVDRQKALASAFQQYSVATYVANFDDYSGEQFDLTPPQSGDDVVRVKIVPGPSGGETHTLGYVMQQTGGKWKAIDVIADGFISQGAVQKAQIRAIMALSGIDGLLSRLQNKTADIAGGPLR
ncbi:MAG TPA: ABC transporter substrate-binding protein [Stellaceae bacterium]|nr:ABC transporter substrate-binding protein [Stellaceae bacterium]